MEKRGREVFHVRKAKTERLRKSAVINMQKFLNKDVNEKRDTLIFCDQNLFYLL